LRKRVCQQKYLGESPKIFKHDILLIDIEDTVLKYNTHDPIQLAAVLLDKKTLKEKKSFTSYIKPKHWKNWDPEAMAVNSIDKAQLINAPSLTTVIKRFEELYKNRPVIISYYGGNVDIPFIRKMYEQVGKRYPFDYHAFDLWAVCHTYLAVHNKLKNSKRHAGFTLEDLMKRFDIEIENRHDALADCRAEAAVLRHIYKELQACV
jgi:DNA polymerase III epsilon subunit-like protein